jgi:hypothetical protein
MAILEDRPTRAAQRKDRAQGSAPTVEPKPLTETTMNEDDLQNSDEAEELEERERLLFAAPKDRPRDGFSVLRLRLGRLPLEIFAPIFVDLLRLIRADATRLCQQESGLLFDNIERGLAEQVAKTLQAQGEDCLVVPAAELLTLERPRPVNSLQFTKAGLALADSAGQELQVGWNEIATLALAQVPVETVQTKTSSNRLMTKVAIGFAVGGLAGAAATAALNPAISTRTVKSSTTHLFLDLASTDGSLYFRIDARQFDYRVLGDQLQPSNAANILTLTRWLLTYMPTLRTNIDAEGLKATGATRLGEHSPHGLTQVSQWLLNLAKFDKQPLPPQEYRQY